MPVFFKKKIFIQEKKQSKAIIAQIKEDATTLVEKYKNAEFYNLVEQQTLVKILTKCLYAKTDCAHKFIYNCKYLKLLSTLFKGDFYLSSPYLKMHFHADIEEAGPYHVDTRKGSGKTYTIWDPFERPLKNQRLKLILGSQYLAKIPFLQNYFLNICNSYERIFRGTYIDLDENELLIFDANIIHKENVNDGGNIFATSVVRASQFPYTEGGYCKVTKNGFNDYKLTKKYCKNYQDYSSINIINALEMLKNISFEHNPTINLEYIENIYKNNDAEIFPLASLGSNILLELATYTPNSQVKNGLLLKSLALNPENAATFYNLLLRLDKLMLASLYPKLINVCNSPEILFTLGSMLQSLKIKNKCHDKAFKLDENYFK